ncbi:3-methyladenine DNA glycosylase, partial [Microbacterium testaceum]
MRSTGVRTRQTPRELPVPTERPLEGEYRPAQPVDVGRAVAAQRHGRNDPTYFSSMPLRDGGVVWRVSRTPLGVATLALRQSIGGAVRAAAWGPGAEWALDQLPALCGKLDDPDGFDASRHPSVAEWHRRHPDLRIGRTDLVFDALVSAIMEQKVTSLQAFSAWRSIVTWYGERAPGPTPRPLFA